MVAIAPVAKEARVRDGIVDNQGEVGQMGLVGEACVVTDLSARRSVAFVLLADVVVGKVGARRCGQLIEHSGGRVGELGAFLCMVQGDVCAAAQDEEATR